MRQYEFLKKLAERGKLSHAYLFSGNDHASKTKLIAEILDILAVKQPDQTQVAPAEEDNAKEITIAQIRSLSAFLSMSAWNSPYKVAIIQSAHQMNQEAQSAFLKLLEEPKGDTLFFLCTEYPDMLLSTIRSRTQEVKFYTFESAVAPTKTASEFQKLREGDLVIRFEYAKKLADSPEQIPQTLHEWSLVVRQLLHVAVREDPQAVPLLFGSIRVIQETGTLLRTTNVNPRLALERIMLNL